MSKKAINQALKAYSDIIKSQQEIGREHDPTPTEFFAVISSTIGQAIRYPLWSADSREIKTCEGEALCAREGHDPAF